MVGGESSRGHSAKNAARHELIVIQQGIAERLQQEIENSVGEISPMLELYYQEYWRELQAFETVSSRADLVEACLDAAIVYCGDYHSLSASQRTATKLIEEIADSGRAVTVAIEMVHSEHQYVLDRYQRGEINEAAFLEGVEYRKRWDFQWAPYRDLLAVCRERGIAVRAINTDPGESSTRILERDFHAAERITALTEASEDRLVFVLDGDLHVASEHLPMVVRSMLHTRGVQREHVIVHQNAEPIYWQLAEQGLEQLIDVVRVAADVYCVFSATPIVKLQSYLNWQHDHAELHHYLDPMWLGDEDDEHSHDYAEQVHEIVRTIADFLHIKHDGLQDLTVFTTRDLDFLDALERDERLTPHAIETVKAHVKAGESYFVPGINVIYLADQSLYAAAEEATHFVNSVLAGFDTAPREPR
ncbi:MAG: ChaN family lipoprotein, partial [Planctomycetota bacterium]